MVALIDDGYANRRTGQAARDFQSAKASSYNDDVMTRFQIAHCTTALRFTAALLAHFWVLYKVDDRFRPKADSACLWFG